jgi:hypothetical protein
MKKIMAALIFVSILLLGLIVGVYLVRQRTQITGKAYGPREEGRVELANSYIFASPLRAGVGGEKIRVTIFVLDGQGRGVAGKLVTLASGANLKVEAISATTDDLGRAIFDVSSQTPGLFIIEALVEGKLLPQKVRLTFQ